MKKNTSIILGIFLLVAFTAAFAATNYVHNGDTVTLTWSSTSPTAGDAVVKGNTKALGCIVGVALNGTAVPSERVSVATKGIFAVPVTASSTVGSIGVGDFIYGTVGGLTTSTTVLSNINTGVLFGQAMEAATASTTEGVYSTINVMIRQPGHL